MSTWTPELTQDQREKIDNWFGWHDLSMGDTKKLDIIRCKAKELAKAIFENTPTCADQTAALR